MTTDGTHVYITPCSEAAVVYVNGIKVHSKQQLQHTVKLMRLLMY